MLDGANKGPDLPETILKLDSVKVHYPIVKGFIRRVVGQVKAVDGVSLSIARGETVGLVGESGSGKTSLARAILRIVDPTWGEISYRRENGDVARIDTLGGARLREVRKEIRMIFQDPNSSLDPRYTVEQIIGEPLRSYGTVDVEDIGQRVRELLSMAGLRPEYADRYPHSFSGGERQRIGIARALSLEPRLIVCDEAVSALDVSVQAQIINLLEDLQERNGLTYLFVSHDLSIVRHISDKVAVMYVGHLVEVGETEELFARPLHPYTEALLSAVPVADVTLARTRTRIRLEGEVADPADPPPGCLFHPRCRYATEICRTQVPAQREVTPGRWATCHHSETLNLAGVR